MKKYIILALFAAALLIPFGAFAQVADSCSTGALYNSTTGAQCVGGCLNGALFNSLTGAQCPNAGGCSTGALFNSMTGAQCPNTSGCSNGALFNSMTGAQCTNTGGCSTGALFNSITGKQCAVATPPGVCPFFVTFVCGSDNVTYSGNSCIGYKDKSGNPMLSGVKVVSQGQCTTQPSPVVLSCDNLVQTQQYYYNVCKAGGFQNICFSKDGVYQGCSNGPDDCTTQTLNSTAVTYILARKSTIALTQNGQSQILCSAIGTLGILQSSATASVLNAVLGQGNALPTDVGAAIGSSATQPKNSCVALANDVQYRDNDTLNRGEVSQLQSFLQNQGYLNSNPTGYFGDSTFTAVQAFQLVSGVQSTGFVGAQTRAKIQQVSCQ